MKLKRGFKILLLILLALGLITLLCWDNSDMLTYSSSVSGVSQDADLSFSVLSDIHSNSENFEEAVKELYKINPKADALILNGDNVDQGLDRQYNEMKRNIDKYQKIIPDIVIKNIGNHEFFDYDNGPLAPEQVKTYVDRYLQFSGEENVYHDKWINGYHFIALGSESGSTKELGAVKALIGKDQLKWLDEKLAENYTKGKPIFVFLHQHLDTSMRGWVGTDQANEINKILSKYKEVVLFTSHTHVSLKVNNVFTERPFTIVHTGGVNYQIETNENGGRIIQRGNQGIYVEVKDNKVIVRGREFKDRKWIFEKELSFGS